MIPGFCVDFELFCLLLLLTSPLMLLLSCDFALVSLLFKTCQFCCCCYCQVEGFHTCKCDREAASTQEIICNAKGADPKMNFSQLQGERYKRLPIGAQIISDCKVMHRLQGYRGNWSLESLLASERQAMRESLPVWTRLYFLLNLWSFSGLVSVLNSWFFEFLFLGFLVPSVQPCGSSSSLDLIQRLPPYRSAVSPFFKFLAFDLFTSRLYNRLDCLHICFIPHQLSVYKQSHFPCRSSIDVVHVFCVDF